MTRTSIREWVPRLGVVAAGILFAGSVHAQSVKIGVQTGLGYLPLQVMVHDQLLLKHAQQLGLNDVKPEIVTFSNAGAMNDALLSHSIQYASGGVSTFLTLWSKAGGSSAVKAAGGLVSMPMYLNTRSSSVKTIRDFGQKDRIGVAGVKVGYQAILLQMAAAQAFGEKNYARLDPLTVTISNPDGLLVLSNPRSEINTHFAPPPYAQRELKIKGVHTVLKSYDILGGPATLDEVWSTAKFRDANPKLHQAFVAALKESMDRINADRSHAADVYLKMSGDKTPKSAILEQLNDSDIQYSIVPSRTMAIADFMRKIGSIKKPFRSWRDFHFEEIAAMPGS